MKKGDRVEVKTSQGWKLGNVLSTRSGKVTVAVDGSFTEEGSYRTFSGLDDPRIIKPSDAPLPEECARPLDDPTLAYTCRFSKNGGMRMTDDGYTYSLDVLKDGSPTGLTIVDDGNGGEVYLRGGGEVRDEFEAAVKEWCRLNGHEGTDLWEWADLWTTLLDGYKGLPNVPWKLLKYDDPDTANLRAMLAEARAAKALLG